MGISRQLRPLQWLAIALLAACGGEQPPVQTSAEAVESRVQREARASLQRQDGNHIELQLEGRTIRASVAGSLTVTDHGNGEVIIQMMSAWTDQGDFGTLRLVAQGLPDSEATTQLGAEGSPGIVLIGVPGLKGVRLRSIDAEIRIESFGRDTDGRIVAVRGSFSGRFGRLDETRDEFPDPTHADALDIAGGFDFRAPEG
jgi:hypothetical protein